jgi:hypothetical protein
MAKQPVEQRGDSEDKWHEYQALEARVLNDSKIAYGLVGVFTAGAITVLGIYLTYVLLRVGGDTFDRKVLIISYPLGIASLTLLGTAFWLLKRFDETSSVRVARTVQVERDLKFYSFRLLPPWEEIPPESEDFILTLGELVTRKNRRSAYANELLDAGKNRKELVRRGFGVTKRYGLFAVAMLVLWVLIGVLVWFGSGS